MSATTRRVVILVGPIGAGKTTAAKHLSTLGFTYFHCASLVARLTSEDNPSLSSLTDRHALQTVGAALLDKHGHIWFAEQILSSVQDEQLVAIDGLRSKEAARYLKSHLCGCRIIYIESELEARLGRVQQKDGVSREQYVNSLKEPVEAQVEATKPMADYVVENSGALDLFLQAIERIAFESK